MGGEEQEKKENSGYGERLREITAVLKKHAITRGVSPEKLRLILEDLGPTYIKLGQIMSLRSDILPKRYCDELMKLCSDVPPMPFSQVIEVLEESMGCPWQEEFQHIEQKPLGAASIAQVHRATLKTGEEVVIKVQRKGIYETMARDIGLMHKAVRLMPPVSIKGMVDLNMVLSELWTVTQEEMNFLTEAANMAEFLYGLEDIVGTIHEKLEQAGTGEFSLDEIEERLDLIYRLKRKYGNSEEEILEYGQRAEAELETIQTSETRKTEMEETIKKLLAKANELAKTNRGKRQKAAKIIETKINAELSELNMEGAKFSVHFEPCALCKNGMDKVEFLLSANQGEPPKPLAKIVSGGELSRIMLALKNVLVAGDAAGTLIFDEIDSGISGRAAGKVGIKLREISEKKQVLCVTHLPQIASLSEHHFKISKLQENNRTNTTIQLLNQQEKISEIALMIGGDNVTETTVAQAAEMIRKGKQGEEK